MRYCLAASACRELVEQPGLHICSTRKVWSLLTRMIQSFSWENRLR